MLRIAIVEGDPRWATLMDQITLEECMIRTAFGGTSTKAIESIMSPEAIQNDGPNGFNSYPLGQYANTDATSGDPCAVDANDPNLTYKMGTMVNETVIGQTFNKELAGEYGKVLGNYSLWSNLTILWGVGNALTAATILFAVLTLGAAAMYVMAARKKKENV